MSELAVARRYARGILEFAKESGLGSSLATELTEFAALLEGSEDLKHALTSPMVGESQRDAILQDVCASASLSAGARNVLRVVLSNGRLSVLRQITSEFARMVDEHGGIVRATVTSAAPLSDGYVARLKAELERATGKKILLTLKQDASLLAGVVTQVGDTVVDGSLRSKLSSFKESISLS